MARRSDKRPGDSRCVADSLAGWLTGIDNADVDGLFEGVTAPQLRTLDVCRFASSALILTEGGRHQPLLNRGLGALEFGSLARLWVA